ncbi:hypothetical protein [Persicitalea jodogahamensis]|uniref:Uncharacterized protein n=1 Tax=Persicitalea jodogahamensis TaxID=402147 RepID=A0A8J3D7L6_9BACT|nr:hypothetical protein [Persicitalea jodogahamensis]GHB57175.1 hypothetical protein GCM10007390_08240 [Persicitalea jodogahamensis]
MRKTILFVSVLAVSIWSCGGSEETQEEKEPENAMEAIQQMADKAKEMQENGPVDPVDFRELKEMLPSSAGGLSRTEATGEKNGAMGFSLSQAEGKYEEGDSSMEINIVDTGGVGGMAMMGMAAWAMAEVDKETATGYEKTTTVDGNKAYEKYDNERQNGELNVIVGNRFIVSVKGRKVSMDQIKDTLDDIDIDKLADME